MAFDIETDQEIRTDTDQFPEHKHHRHIARNHHAEHAETEQRQILEKAIKTAAAVEVLAVGQRNLVVDKILVQFIVHVTQGVEVHARGNQGHHAEHHHRDGVDVVANRELQVAKLTERIPVPGVIGRRTVVGMRTAWPSEE